MSSTTAHHPYGGSQTIFVREYPLYHRKENRSWENHIPLLHFQQQNNLLGRLYTSNFDFQPDFPPPPTQSDSLNETSSPPVPNPPSQPTVSPFHKMLSACAGAVLTSLMATPFDVVKTRMQSSGIPLTPPAPPTSAAFISSELRECCRDMLFALDTRSSFRQFYTPPTELCAAVPHGACVSIHSAARAQISRAQAEMISERNAKRFTGTMDGMIKILRAEGPSGLYRGLSPTLLMSLPSTVVYYVGYEHIRDAITPYTSLAPLVAGCSARTIAATLISPLELIRTRTQAGVMGRSFAGISEGVAGMIRSGGYQSLWRGLKPTLWRDVPFSGIYWILYENIKKTMNKARSDTEEFWTSFVAGATSGTVAAFLTTPFDVAKTIQQVSLVNNDPRSEQLHISRRGTHMAPPKGVGGRSPGLTDTLRWIVERDGVGGLFRGLSPRIAKVAPACAIMISSYELGKRVFANDV
ncbi:mitochondrial carrier domain-containing protein [Cladochytrium replicatum]|nr:mitochondrial carrier domain-containing protein [Cladochytrium replicatum]